MENQLREEIRGINHRVISEKKLNFRTKYFIIMSDYPSNMASALRSLDYALNRDVLSYDDYKTMVTLTVKEKNL